MLWYIELVTLLPNGLQYLLEKEFTMNTIMKSSLAAEYGVCTATITNWIRTYREECQTNDAAISEYELM